MPVHEPALKKFGANSLLGYSVELAGEEVEKLNLSDRITISSMATEMGAIAILIPPSDDIIRYCSILSGKETDPVFADTDAVYAGTFDLNLNGFFPAISRPGKPHDVVPVEQVKGIRIDSAFIGSCTNGRIEDMRVVAELLRNRKVAPGVVLKIVPSTDEVWNECLSEGLIDIFKKAGAMVSNAGCAGCAAGQVGQNGPGEVTVSTGNRNFAGKQGKGDVYLASPATAAASAVSGCITTAGQMVEKPLVFTITGKNEAQRPVVSEAENHKPTVLEGKVWIIDQDDIDTDMIFHNRHLAITNIGEMGQYTFGNLKGWEDYAKKSEPGDIVITGKNFGAGSSRQQAVDCFKSIGNLAILAESFGAIYERNAINAGFPLLTYKSLHDLELVSRDTIRINLEKGQVTNLRNGKTVQVNKFYEIQMMIYQKGDLLKL